MGPFQMIFIGICLLAVCVALYRLMWPSKKPCQNCKKQTRDSNQNGPMCEACRHADLFKEATKNGPQLLCPIHQQWMEKRIILDTNYANTPNVVVHECPDPTCSLIIFNKDRLHQITMQSLDFYPTKEAKAWKKCVSYTLSP